MPRHQTPVTGQNAQGTGSIAEMKVDLYIGVAFMSALGHDYPNQFPQRPKVPEKIKGFQA